VGDLWRTNPLDRFRQRADGIRSLVNPCHEAFARLFEPADGRDGRVGQYIVLKGICPVHLDDGFYGETLRRYELAQTGAVLVEHPTVGADEGAHAARSEHL
jgi:hypothetical protein